MDDKPRGYRIIKHRCCDNCHFVEEYPSDEGSIWVCELFGEATDGTLGLRVRPTGRCEAHKRSKKEA